MIPQRLSRWHVWREERALVVIGLTLCCVAALMQAAIWVRGTALVLPEGDLSRAVSFGAAVGMFVLSTALILPVAPLDPRGRRRFRNTLLVFAVYGLVIENLQHARGIDPRFSSYGDVVDLVLGILFGLFALAVVVTYTDLTLRFFRTKESERCPSLLKVGIEYGLVTTAMGMASGIWMSILQGRFVAESGNIIWLHGFGFHGLQAVPLIAWLLLRADVDRRIASRLAHIGGVSWAACIALIGLQTLLGRDLYTWEALPMLSLVAAVLWVGVIAKATLEWVQRSSDLSFSQTISKGE